MKTTRPRSSISADLLPGDDVILITVSGQVSGQRLAPVHSLFVLCDYFKSEVGEYDANYVFVDLDYLQRLRTMENRATSIQIKLKDYADAQDVMKRLKDLQFVDSRESVFPGSDFAIMTWEQKCLR